MNCSEKLNSMLAEWANDAANVNSKILLWLDENISVAELQLSKLKHRLCIATNRIDEISELKHQGIDSYFSDFSIDQKSEKYDAIFYRISKERAVTHHCINLSLEHLSETGVLVLIGRKEDGIKNYFDKCRKTLGLAGELKKDKHCYSTKLSFSNQTHSPDLQGKLDDQNYRELRRISDTQIANKRYTIFSKPGVYGWKKLDTGTQFLIDTLSESIELNTSPDMSALDLGCGSGHLCLALSAWKLTRITATDNNAAAILAVSETLKRNEVLAKVIASNAGDIIDERFELIVSNPPFHKGFDTDPMLSKRFIKACKRLLKINGRAYFVTNSFVNIERYLNELGMHHKQLTNNKQFKVLQITHG